MKRASRRNGFTLVELVMTCGVSAILVGGLTSAVVLASRALPDPNRAPSGIQAESGVLTAMMADLQYARYITERGAHAVTFVVADRDGDGSVERIRYAWSSAAGDALTREYNGGAAVDVLNDVRQFDLTYNLSAVVEQYPGPLIETAEIQFAARSTPTTGADYTVQSNRWIGQYLQPPTVAQIPSGAAYWRLSRVQFLAKRSGSAGSLTNVQVRTANADHTPTGTVLEQQVYDEQALSSAYVWRETEFASLGRLPLDQGLCFVLQHGGGNPSAQVRYDNGGGTNRLTTSDGGSSWTCDAAKSILYYAYGTAMSRGAAQTLTRQYVTSVRAVVQAGADTGTKMDTTARTFNAPEVLSAAWEQEFDADPTTIDTNGDGTGDWVRSDAQLFSQASLSSGIWTADCTLNTTPTCDFTMPTTVEVRLRNTSVGGDGAVFSINVDNAPPLRAPLIATLQLQANGTQTLTLYGMESITTRVPLVVVRSLGADFAVVRLLIDPSHDTVHVRVGGVDQGTYTYNTIASANADGIATVMASGSTAQFDYVRVRVGG